jgi:predicted CXXCH cytochrome family protein
VRRITLLLAGAAVWLFLAAVPVFADGGPHVVKDNNGFNGINADSCAGCHRAHTAQAATYLLTEEVPAMCYACHNGAATGATTDVVNGLQYGAIGSSGTVVGALRNGGFTNTHIGSAAAVRQTSTTGRLSGFIPASSGAKAVTSTHSVDGTAQLAYGYGVSGTNTLGLPGVKLECTTCHNPHGNGNYRILNPLALSTSGSTNGQFVIATSGATVVSTSGITAGIFVTDDTTHTGVGADTRNYTIHQRNSTPNATTGVNDLLTLASLSGVTSSWSGDYLHRYVPWSRDLPQINDNPNGQPATYYVQMTNWCLQCHSRLFGNSGTRTGGTTDTVFKYRHTANSSSRNCVQCHVSHGTSADMDSKVTSQELVPGQSGFGDMTSSYLLKVDNRGTCQLCHDPTGTYEDNPTTYGAWAPPGAAAPVVP